MLRVNYISIKLGEKRMHLNWQWPFLNNRAVNELLQELPHVPFFLWLIIVINQSSYMHTYKHTYRKTHVIFLLASHSSKPKPNQIFLVTGKKKSINKVLKEEIRKTHERSSNTLTGLRKSMPHPIPHIPRADFPITFYTIVLDNVTVRYHKAYLK